MQQAFAGLLALAAIAGCTTSLRPGPDLGGLYDRAARADDVQQNPALDVPAAPPPGTTLHLFSGDAVPTPAVMRVGDDGALEVAERQPGDAKVLCTSAVMDERVGRDTWSPGVETPIAWSDVTFVFTDHLAMTRDPSFTDNILWRLFEAPR